MNDLLESMAEHHAERMAIMQESGVTDPVAAAADDLHHCEIAAVMRQCYPNGEREADYFQLVEKSRGKAVADRLRDDVRAAWKQRRIDEAGQA